MDNISDHSLYSSSVEQTIAIAKEFAQRLKPNDVVTLQGGLGAGKTHFTKGLASYFGVDEKKVQSPTYAVIHEYPGKIPLYHFDLYRLQAQQELQEIGFEEYLFNDGICIIEWPDLAAPFSTDTWWAIEIERAQNASEQRKIHICKKQKYATG